MTCDQIQDHLSDFLDPADADVPRQAIAQHLASCPACAEHLAELKAVVAMLRSRKAPEAPADLMDRIRTRLEAEPVPDPAEPAPDPAQAPLLTRVARLINWPSLAAGAVAAGLLLTVGTLVLRTQSPLPSIQTAAVSVATPTAVNIGFDMAEDVDRVTFTIDLPKGLQFLDANNQPVDAHTISWEGSLKRGKTVVPITVRGVQPGKYEILATVRKNQFAKSTKIVLPVEGRQSLVLPVRLSATLVREG